jgi:hypothetical protein
VQAVRAVRRTREPWRLLPQRRPRRQRLGAILRAHDHLLAREVVDDPAPSAQQRASTSDWPAEAGPSRSGAPSEAIKRSCFRMS